MSGLSDLRTSPRLSSEEADAEADLIPVYHPSGFVSERAISLADLKSAGSGGGSGANTFFYKADTTSTNAADPGKGKMRWNNADQTSATQLTFDWLTTDGFDPVLMFQTFAVGDTFIIQEGDFSLNHQVWRKSAPAENRADFFVVPVEFVSANGDSQFKNQLVVAVILQISTTVRSLPGLPTSDRGLEKGSIWNNKGVLNIVC